MSRIVIDEERCKGCLLCTLACPKGIVAQSSRFNQQGYKVAEVTAGEESKCTGCASCAMVCPDVCISVWKTAKPKKAKEAAHV